MLTKKHYQAIAQVIHEVYKVDADQVAGARIQHGKFISEIDLVHRLTKVFLADNPNFDGAKFLGAIRG